MPLLEDRVAGLLHDHPRLTVEEIARKLTARTQTVRDILRDGPFEELPRDAYPSDRSKVWTLATYGADAPGRATEVVEAAAPTGGRQPTHAEQILAVLADRKWHTSREIHSLVFCILHSRISDLRKRGYTIDRRGGGAGAENHEYRLVATPEEVAAAKDSGAGTDAASSGAPAATPPADGHGAPEQIHLGAAA